MNEEIKWKLILTVCRLMIRDRAGLELIIINGFTKGRFNILKKLHGQPMSLVLDGKDVEGFLR